MGKLKNLLAEVLDRLKETQGEEGMKNAYEEYKEVGKEAMSEELIFQILKNRYSAEEREQFFSQHPEVQVEYESRLKKQ